MVVCFRAGLLLSFCFCHLVSGNSENEIPDSGSEIGNIKGLLEFLEHLEGFYVQGGHLLHLQKQMTDLKNTDRSFKGIENLVLKLELSVGNLVSESEQKKDWNPSHILEFFMTEFVKVRDDEIKETESQLVNAFDNLKRATQEELTVYITERSKQKEMLKELIRSAENSKIEMKNDNSEFKDDQEFYTQRWKFIHATKVLLHFAKATLATHHLNVPIEEVHKDLDRIKKETRNQELLGMIGMFEPTFKTLDSLTAKSDWLWRETLKMFEGRLYQNLLFAVTKTSVNGIKNKDQFMKKMEDRLEGFRQRHELAVKKVKDAEDMLSNVIATRVKMEL